MFSNIGKKLMALAQVCSWIVFVCCLFLFLFLLGDRNDNCFFFLFVSPLSFLVFWPLYGFGQLIDDVHTLCSRNTPPAVQSDELPRL